MSLEVAINVPGYDSNEIVVDKNKGANSAIEILELSTPLLLCLQDFGFMATVKIKYGNLGLYEVNFTNNLPITFQDHTKVHEFNFNLPRLRARLDKSDKVPSAEITFFKDGRFNEEVMSLTMIFIQSLYLQK